MTEVTKNTAGDAPNASSTQPAAVPGNPGVEAEGGRDFAHGNRPEPMTQEANEKSVHASDVDAKAEQTDMAGVRVDPITGIAVDQIEASQEDYTGGAAPDGLRSIPIQAFDSRKLKGDEHVTVRGNTVLVRGEPEALGEDRGDDGHLPKSVQAERKAGREAIEQHAHKHEHDRDHEAKKD